MAAQKEIDRLLGLASNKDLCLLCDAKGNILEILGQDMFRYQLLARELDSKRRLNDFFDLNGMTDFGDLRGNPAKFPSKPQFFVYANVENFYTVLSVSSLRVIALESGRYFGLVTVSDIIPNCFPEKSSSLFLIDRKQGLAGFNHTFYLLLRDRFPEPRALMNLPVAEVLSPDPAEIQRLFLERFNPEEEKDFVTVCDNPFPDGAVKENESGSTSFIKLFDGIDMAESDVSALVEFDLLKGHEPYFLLSPEKNADASPDDSGYLMGRHGMNKAFILKRDSYLLASRTVRDEAAPAASQFRFFKMGRSFFLYRDRECLLKYFDFDFGRPGPMTLFLGLRDGCAARFRRARVGLKKTPPAQEGDRPAYIAVRVKGLGERTFILNRFHNSALTSTYPDVEGFFLQDITGIQNRVEDLQRQYEKQRKRGNRLEGLLRAAARKEEAFIGAGREISSLKEKARIIASSSATVLLQGATGTGKEVLAHYIHGHSPFKEGPFVKVDCSTLPRDLMESELFGHEKGSFTGAIQQKTGMFEQADHGTLFLDEVGNLTAEAQAKLLHFLQDFTIFRVGGDRPIPLSLRVIAAANVNLESLVRQGLFREDLYYRLFVIVFTLPPLKERMEDMPALCQHFVRVFSEAARKSIEKISPAAFKKIYDYDWPGNVRELKNVIQRAVLFCGNDEITEDLIDLRKQGAGPLRGGQARPAETRPVAGDVFHKLAGMSQEDLESALKNHKGNIQRMAREIGVTRRALYYHFKNKNIDPDKYR